MSYRGKRLPLQKLITFLIRANRLDRRRGSAANNMHDRGRTRWIVLCDPILHAPPYCLLSISKTWNVIETIRPVMTEMICVFETNSRDLIWLLVEVSAVFSCSLDEIFCMVALTLVLVLVLVQLTTRMIQ
jgi:hypothetical protein